MAKIAGLLNDGADQEALALAEAALPAPETGTVATCALAAIYYRAGALGYSIKLLVSLLERPGYPADIPEVLAVLYCLAGCVPDALYYAKLSLTEGESRAIQTLFGPDFPPFADAFAQMRPKPMLGNGMMALMAGDLERAQFLVAQHLSLLPDDVEALDTYAKIMVLTGKNNEAIGLLRTVATLAGPSATLLSRLAGCLIQSGQFQEGLACHREAIARVPNSLPILGAAVADLRFFGKAEAEASGIIRSWNAELTKSVPRTVRPAPKFTGASPIRICYLCTSLDSAEVMSMVGAVAQAHDRSRVTVVGFGRNEIDSPANRWARGAFDLWRDVSNLDVTTMGALIRGEGIHVAIDADGILAANMRGLFQRNTAPLQVTWLNSEVSGRIPGQYLRAVPGPGEPAEGELMLAAGRYFLGATDGKAAVTTAAPAESAGTITFGAELIGAELNPQLAMVWGRVLQAVPKSVLLLRDNGLCAAPANVDALVSLFGNAGVAHRIDVIRNVERAEFAASVDIALLPFPAGNILAYSEFLRNGVPVVVTTCCAGGADMGAFLTAAGLGETLVGADVDGYVAAALALAGDIPALASLRRQIPERISAVPEFSPKGFARALEDAVIAALTQLHA
ncbi:MAG: hypothetical protein EPN20_11330 [Magnetospirillum sp.]|nr:MAG: hypothetical protein EPN20_11330 [Magnetospirillum sp.]